MIKPGITAITAGAILAVVVSACGGGGSSAPQTASQILRSNGYIPVTASQSSEVAMILSGVPPASDVSAVASPHTAHRQRPRYNGLLLGPEHTGLPRERLRPSRLSSPDGQCVQAFERRRPPQVKCPAHGAISRHLVLLERQLFASALGALDVDMQSSLTPEVCEPAELPVRSERLPGS
jgi:hypothetical protein